MPKEMPVKQLLASLDMFGMDAHALLDEAAPLNIDMNSLAKDPNAIITAQDFGSLFIAMVRKSQLAAGIEEKDMDMVLSLSSYRVMFTYIIHSATLQEALERAANYFSRFEEHSRTFTLDTAGDTTRWTFNLGDIDEQARPSAADLSMGQLRWLPGLPGRMLALYLWHRQASWLTGNYIDLIGVHFDCNAHGSANAYTDSFGAPVYFNSDWCGMEFHSRYLSSPLVQNEAGLERMLSNFPAQLIEADELSSSIAARVTGLIGTDFSKALPSLEEVAERMFMTSTTLHRRLRDEGTSFQKVKDGCRRDAAIQLLRDEANSGTAIAEYLGFSDPSAFFRAFKKWTGLTPQQFRSRKA